MPGNVAEDPASVPSSTDAMAGGLPVPSIPRDEAATRALVRRRTVRRRAAVGGGVTAVAVVLILVLTGIVPLVPASAGSSGIPFSSAKALAEGVLPSGYGSPATVLVATGIESRGSTVLAVQAFTALATSNCTLTELSGYPTAGNLTVPSYTGGWNSGLAPFWVFAFEANATGTFAMVAVEGATALPIATLSGPHCGTVSTGPHPLPALVADSPLAAESAWNHSATTFVGQDANATTETMTAYGGASSGPATSSAWVFVYAPCTPLVTGSVARPALLVEVSLTSATFEASATYTSDCPT